MPEINSWTLREKSLCVQNGIITSRFLAVFSPWSINILNFFGGFQQRSIRKKYWAFAEVCKFITKMGWGMKSYILLIRRKSLLMLTINFS